MARPNQGPHGRIGAAMRQLVKPIDEEMLVPFFTTSRALPRNDYIIWGEWELSNLPFRSRCDPRFWL